MNSSHTDYHPEMESNLRQELAQIQDTILDFHGGNIDALSKAQDHGMRLVMEAVSTNAISPVIAEGLKKKIRQWSY